MESLLFLAHRVPFPPNKGDKIRSHHFLRALSRSFQVHLGAFVDDPHDWRWAGEVRALCRTTCLRPLRPPLAKLRSLGALLMGWSLTERYFHDRRLNRWVRETVRKHGIRKALVYSSSMFPAVAPLAASGSLDVVLDCVDVDSEKWRQYADRARWPWSWIFRREGRRLLELERAAAESARAVVFVTREEAELFIRRRGGSREGVTWIPNGVDTGFFDPSLFLENPYRDEPGPVAVFTGAMDYWANAEGVSWFVREVWGQVRRSVPGASFYIVGARPLPSVRRLGQEPGVRVTGFVEDTRPYLAHARVALAPLLVARGLQNKVLEALAMGLPVVGTPGALEGLAAPEGAVEAAEGPDAWAAAVAGALKRDAPTPTRREIHDWVERHHGWGPRLDELRELLEGSGGRAPA